MKRPEHSYRSLNSRNDNSGIDRALDASSDAWALAKNTIRPDCFNISTPGHHAGDSSRGKWSGGEYIRDGERDLEVFRHTLGKHPSQHRSRVSNTHSAHEPSVKTPSPFSISWSCHSEHGPVAGSLKSWRHDCNKAIIGITKCRRCCTSKFVCSSSISETMKVEMVGAIPTRF